MKLTKAKPKGRILELSELWQMASLKGRVRIFESHRGNERVCATITRTLGKSELSTSDCWDTTPERALLKAIEQADSWGLPDLERRRCLS